MSLCFFGRGYISREGVKFSSSQFFLCFFFFGEGGGGSWWGGARKKGVRSIIQGGADSLEDTTVDFWKVIYKNIEKNVHIFIYTGFEVL